MRQNQRNKSMRLALALAIITAICAVIILIPSVHAAAFGCEIRASCLGNQTLLLTLNSSEAGSAPNNSHAYLANYSSAGPYAVCCWTDAFRTLTNSCLGNGAHVLGVWSTNNSHVQQGNYSSYAYAACLNVTQGNVSCTYADSTCPGGYSNVLSMSSSESADVNQTNAHLGAFGYYLHKVCCQIGGQNPPTIAWVNISPANFTSRRTSLECQNGTTSDPDGDNVTLHYNWLRNGTSITLLNLPMDYDSNTGVSHDISGFAHHMTVNVNTSFTPVGGRVGGAFVFDGITSYLSRTHDADFNSSNYTLVAWIKPQGTYATNAIVGSNQFLFQLDANSLSFYGDVGLAQATSSVFAYSGGTWMFVAVTYDRGSSNATFYKDGVFLSTHSLAANDRSFSTIFVGSYTTSARFFNGSIDEVMMFNRSLSTSEIATLYNSNNRWFNATELRRTEGWNCSITPVDSTGLNGSTKFSNMTIVNGSKPLAVNLSYPLLNNQSVFERYVNFTWTQASELDGDTLNYTLYVAPSGTCAVSTTQSNLFNLTNYTFGELCVDNYYNWTVNVCDIDGCAGNTTIFNFTVLSTPSITLLVNMSQLGLRNPGESVQTNVTAGLTPFVVNNTGNVRVNITIVGNNSPFSSQGLSNNNYTYAAGINKSNAFNTAASQMTFAQFTSSYTNLLKMLNYSIRVAQSNTTANIEINLTIPYGEPGGNKQGNITLQSVMGGP